MEQKKPMELGLQLLKDINIVRHNEFRFINAEFGFVTSFSKMETTIFSVGQPYRLQEGRIAIVTNGSARVLINLIEYIFLPDHISLIAPNSIIQIIEVSHDFDAHMMAVDLNFLPISGKEELLFYMWKMWRYPCTGRSFTIKISLRQERWRSLSVWLQSESQSL